MRRHRRFHYALPLVALLALAAFALCPPTTSAASAFKTFPASGGNAVIPLPADFDGDGATDIATFDPATGVVSFLPSSSAFNGSPRSIPTGVTVPDAQPLAADFDGDLTDDPALLFFNGLRWVAALHTSRDGLTHYYSFPFGAPAFIALTADVDGDGLADPLVYRPATGAIYALLSSRGFSADDDNLFAVYTGIANGKPFVVDYDHGVGSKDDTRGNYPRGRDFLDDLAVLGENGSIYIVTSHYGLYNNMARIDGLAEGGDTPVVGDFDGDGIKDVAVYRPGSGESGGQFRALLSSRDFSLVVMLTYSLGSSGAPTQDVPVVGRYDLDYKTDFGVYRRGSAGEWQVAFSEGSLNVAPTTYPSRRYGMAMANWDDSLKTCYASGVGLTPDPSNGHPFAPGSVMPCRNEMFYEDDGVSEMAQTLTRDGVTYRLHPYAMNVSWGDYLDPRSNMLLFMFKYMAASGISDSDKPFHLVYAHDIPGAIQVAYDQSLCNLIPDTSKCQDPDGGRRLVFTDHSVIFQRAALKRWLIQNRQGPSRDPRRWYTFLVGSEMDGYAQTSPDTYARILRDYTRFLAEVRDEIKAQYGITVHPAIVMSSAAMGCNYIVGPNTIDCDHRPRRGNEPYLWPAVEAYYTAVLQKLTRPLDIDFDGDGNTTDDYETWTPDDVRNFLDFFQYYSLDPFFNHPLGGDALIGKAGDPGLAQIDDFANQYANRLREVGQNYYNLRGCWDAASGQYEACRRPLLLPQMGTRYWGTTGQGWEGPHCPTTPPQQVCDYDDRYPYDQIRYTVLYVTARLTQTLMRNLDANPGHIAAWAYWQGIDTQQTLDPTSRKTWGSLESSVEPALDFDKVCDGSGCRKTNVRFTPVGQVYVAAAAGDFDVQPAAFLYTGNGDRLSGTMRLTLPRPAWWP
ncbi:MAG: hypothetical protein U0822_06720 [Anaerolineae bacterium]